MDIDVVFPQELPGVIRALRTTLRPDGALYARERLASEQGHPLQTDDGRALMAVWECDFSDASLGPHHEREFSVFASARPLPPLAVGRPRPDPADAGTPRGRHAVPRAVEQHAAGSGNRELVALDARLPGAGGRSRAGGLAPQASERSTLRYLDESRDRLEFGDTRYARPGFRPAARGRPPARRNLAD